MKLPDWLHKTLRTGSHDVAQTIRARGLCTVCEEALCPNRAECYRRNHATFLLLGPACTRSCAFCAVRWTERPDPPDPSEPDRVARVCAEFGLKHIVLTMVTRDDLEDGGAAHLGRAIESVREHVPGATIEVLTSDFRGRRSSLDLVMQATPSVFSHNLETVRALSSRIRSRATYEGSLTVLKMVKEISPGQVTKSGLMVGLGESGADVLSALEDLSRAGVDRVTIGQYLQPSPAQIRVAEWVHPDQFLEYERYAKNLGFSSVLSGPFIRSSSIESLA